MQGAATEKARSPSLSPVDCWTRSLLQAEPFEARPGRPVKIVPEMTYYLSSGTLNPTHSLTRPGMDAVVVSRSFV